MQAPTPSSDSSKPAKRKGPPASDLRTKKRMKLSNHRTVSSQTTDKAFSNGELNVDKFVRAREYEIKALEEGLKNSKHGLATRAFQEVPRDMRRRTASHNVKRVPKRLRARARREMVEDNTPTVTARRRKPTPRQRLRLETATRLQNLSKKTKKRREEKKETTAAAAVEVDIAEKDSNGKGAIKSSVEPRKAKVKKSRLRKPDVPPAKFRRRQIHKTWLPTHIYHAKRATMTPPKEPLWRFALPLSPANKVYRLTHRASTLRGAVAWDSSYVSTIGLEGAEKSVEGLLKALGVGCDGDREGLWASQGAKWRQGTRSWEGWLYEREGWPSKAVTPAVVLWNPAVPAEQQPDEPTKAGLERDDAITQKPNRKRLKRQAFIRTHPAGFLQLWEQVTRLAKVQKPMVSVEDLRFEVGSIELIGPNATEALVGTLWPALPVRPEGRSPTNFDSIWAVLKTNPDPSTLPRNAVLSFCASDPRLHFPAHKEDSLNDLQKWQASLQVLVDWPVDNDPHPAAIFNRNDRLKAKRSLPSQQSINRRKAAATPGVYPEPRPTDAQIPVLLYTSKASLNKQAIWTILLPWKTVLPVWACLVRYPLSCGGLIRFGGLNEKRQLAFETGTPWFPGDYPGTKAGDEWEAQESAKRKTQWERKPKGRRLEYTSLTLGNGRKGEVGLGWACDWKVLGELSGVTPESPDADGDVKMVDARPKPAFYHLPTPFAARCLSQNAPDLCTVEMALVTVKITMITRGVPKTCARIYRLPRNDPELRKQWIAQRPSAKGKSHSGQHVLPRRPTKDASADTFRGYLAANILDDQPIRPGGEGYPVVPGQEDLIGFLTTGNYNLGEGMGTGIGSILLTKVFPLESEVTERRLCIVRDSGETIGRLARWELV